MGALLVESIRQLVSDDLVGESGEIRRKGVSIRLVLDLWHEAHRLLYVVELDELDYKRRVSDGRALRVGKAPQTVPIFALGERVEFDVPVPLVRHLEVGSQLLSLLGHVAEEQLSDRLVERQSRESAAVTILLL